MKNLSKIIALVLCSATLSAPLARAGDDCKIVDRARLAQVKAANEIAIQKAFASKVQAEITRLETAAHEDTDGSFWRTGGMLGAGIAGLLVTYWMADGGAWGEMGETGYKLIGTMLKKNPVFGAMMVAATGVTVLGGYRLYIHTSNISHLKVELEKQVYEMAKLEAEHTKAALELQIAQKRIGDCPLTPAPAAPTADSVQVKATPAAAPKQ